MKSSQKVMLGTAFVSGLFAAGLGIVGHIFGSELAYAQAADSLLDFAGAFLLAWVVRVAQKPRDESHPWGHARAEPLGALGVAMLAAMLALRVAQGAIQALIEGVAVQADALLLEVFLAKVLFKSTVVLLARRAKSPALRALAVDARNDVLVGLVSVFGYIGMKFGYSSLDAILSLPVAAWIGWSGFDLASENIDLLMGRAPPAERQDELLSLARRIDGVINAHDLRAHHLGVQLSIHVHVTVDHRITVQAAHDIGERVRQIIESEEDVLDCSVHIDPDEPEAAPASTDRDSR